MKFPINDKFTRRHMIAASLAASAAPIVSRAQSTPPSDIALDSFAPLWEQPIESRYPSIPLIYEDEIYVSTTTGLVHLNGWNGKIARELELGFNPTALTMDSRGYSIFGTGIADESPYVTPPFAIDRYKLELLWTSEHIVTANSPAKLGPGRVFVGEDNTIRSINSETGEIEWSFPLEGVGTGAVAEEPSRNYESMATSEDLVFVANAYGQIYGFSYKHYDERYSLKWMTSLNAGQLWTPIHREGLLIIGNHETIWGLDPESGTVLWQSDADVEVFRAPVATSSRIALLSRDASHSGWLLVLDAETGEEQIRIALPSDPYSPNSGILPLSLAGDHVIATLPMYEVIEIDLERGEIVSELRTGPGTLGTPAVFTDDLLILRSRDGTVTAWRQS